MLKCIHKARFPAMIIVYALSNLELQRGGTIVSTTRYRSENIFEGLDLEDGV